jgi:hypothetical protein
MGLPKNEKKMDIIVHCVEHNFVLWIQKREWDNMKAIKIFRRFFIIFYINFKLDI